MLLCHYVITLLMSHMFVILMSKIQQNKITDEISTDNLNKPIPKTLRINHIEGKVIHVNGRNTFMGKPSQFTHEDKLIDGKEEKFVISTVETLSLQYKDEGVQKISNFFVTEIVYDRIGNLAENIEELFENGKNTGPCVVCKMWKPDRKQSYWSILSEKEYNESDSVIKPTQ